MFWWIVGAIALGAIASSGSSSRSALQTVRSDAALLGPLKLPPRPAKIMVEVPSGAQMIVTLIVVTLVLGAFAAWLWFSGLIPQEPLPAGVLAILVPIIGGGVAAGGLASYQRRLHDRACAFAATVHAEELRTWEAECRRIVEEHAERARLRAEEELDDDFAREGQDRAKLEKAACENRRLEGARRRTEERTRARSRLKHEAAVLRLADERGTQRVRAALAWWVTEYPHLDERAKAFWPDIVGQAPTYRARYDDPTDLCGTAERCRELAAWALAHVPAEVAHFLADGPPSVDQLAMVLRRHHGREIEELLPRARALQREERLRPPADLNYPPSELEIILQELPEDVRAELKDEYGRAMLREDFDRTDQRVIAVRRQQLEERDAAQEEIEVSIDRLHANLKAAAQRWAIRKGMV